MVVERSSVLINLFRGYSMKNSPLLKFLKEGIYLCPGCRETRGSLNQPYQRLSDEKFLLDEISDRVDIFSALVVERLAVVCINHVCGSSMRITLLP